MSKPSFSNIDLWLFELSEGNLSPSQVEQLKMFLLMHPELDVDKDVWDSARLEKTEYVYTKKENLKREYPIYWLLDATSAAAVIAGIVIFGFLSNDTISDQKFQTSQNDVKNVNTQKSSETSDPKFNAKSNRLKNNGSNKNAALNKSINTIIPTKAFLKSSQSTFRSPELEIASQANSNSLVAQRNTNVNRNSSIVKNNSNVDNNIYVASNEKEYGHQSILDESPSAVNSLETATTYKEFNHPTLDLEPSKYKDVAFLPERDRSVKRFVSSYNLTFKSKAGAFGRKMRNMMDNPIALKNFRDPHYNIPGLSVSDVNFSSAGNQLASRVQTLTRLQWYRKENQQMMNQLNIDGYVYGMRGGLALQINHSTYRKGGVSVADVALTYSPKIALSNTVSFEPAIRFKMGNKNLRHAKMEGINQVELERGVVEDYYADGSTPIGRNLWYQDFGVGFLVNTKWFFAGVQMDNLFRHKDNMFSNTSLNPQRSNYNFIASLGTDWVSSNKALRLSPYLVYQNEGRLNELWAGVNAELKGLVVGASYSTSKDPSATIGVKFKHFSMYYNADYSKSKMTGERNLSHQLTLKVVGKQSRFGKGR